MFGYIQPLKCELKMKEYESYRAAYCGLCNALRIKCGFKARFIVNYDFVFAALLLAYADGEKPEIKKKRCLVCPSGKNCIISKSYEKAADVSVILTYLKLCDDVEDKSFISGLFKARLPKFLLRGAYKKASNRLPQYNSSACRFFKELSELERVNETSIDKTADKFANMLAAISEGEDKTHRVLNRIFYHIGRYVYIIDAFDDFKEDMEKSEYNPIAARYGLTNQNVPEGVRADVLITLRNSIREISAAFELLDKSENHNLLKNVIELGMNATVYRVFNKGEHLNERSL